METKITFEDIKELLPKRTSLYYVDYRDSLDEHTQLINECLEAKSGDRLYEKVSDWYIDSPHYAFEELNKELVSDLVNEFDIEEEEAEELIEEYRELIEDHYYNVDDSTLIKDLCRNSSDVNVRVTMYSNYDCINSHWFETSSCGGYGYKESYFGAMVDALKLNPSKVKQMLNSHDVNTFGSFPNLSYRNGKELVSYEQFWVELQNSICGANNLIFVGKISIQDLVDNDFKIDSITIPKGNNCGLFSSFQGGGSVIEMELTKDVKIDFNKHGKTKYDSYSLHIDGRNCGGYSIEEVYGVTDAFWGSELIINKAK